MNKKLLETIQSSLYYIEKNGYKSYDFYDALSSPYLNKIPNQLIRRIVIQLNGRSLINFRPILGIEKKIHTKAISDLLSIYSKLYLKDENEEYLNKARFFYDLLLKRALYQKNGGIAWGLNFPYTSRFVTANENTPNLFNTINSCLALLDYYEIVKDENISTQVSGILNFIFNDLGIVTINDSQKWLRYYPGQKIPTFNVNALAASTFLKINNTFEREIIHENMIHSLINFLISGQNDDGSWYYSMSKNGHWIDGFHSGYIIEGLSYLAKYDFINGILLKKGADYFIKNFFTKEGIPKYYNNHLYPIEAQNCAQAIQTISHLIINNNFQLYDLLHRTITQTFNFLYDKKGYFYYKRTKLFVNRNVFFRWSVTPMVLALLYANEAFAKE